MHDSLLPAREQMALSLGWHIVLACFGVAFPVLIGIVHRKGLQGDAEALLLARRWSKVAAVLFATGAVSGTVLSFEMGLLWPGLMGTYGDVLGLPFALEGIAFFVEAIFLGIYLYGWNKLPPKVHIRTLIPVAIAGVVGTFCVVSVNAWMNDPVGFSLDSNGRVVDVDPWRAMLNHGSVLQFLHLWVAAFMVVGFCVAGVYAWGLLQGRDDRYHRLGATTGLAVATVFTLVQPLVGHFTGTEVASRQPAKLASIELSPRAEARAPLTLGGVLVDGEVRYAIRIPRLGSVLATNDPDGVVPGLYDIPAADRPKANVVHLAFQAMVGIAFALAGLVGLWLLQRKRGHDLLDRRWFRRALVAAGPAAIAALELGWVVTELGRQPWIVYRVLRTANAVTTRGGVWFTFGTIVVLYGAMTWISIAVLRSMARRWRAGEGADLPTPYGPPAKEG